MNSHCNSYKALSQPFTWGLTENRPERESLSWRGIRGLSSYTHPSFSSSLHTTSTHPVLHTFPLQTIVTGAVCTPLMSPVILLTRSEHLRACSCNILSDFFWAIGLLWLQTQRAENAQEFISDPLTPNTLVHKCACTCARTRTHTQQFLPMINGSKNANTYRPCLKPWDVIYAPSFSADQSEAGSWPETSPYCASLCLPYGPILFISPESSFLINPLHKLLLSGSPSRELREKNLKLRWDLSSWRLVPGI